MKKQHITAFYLEALLLVAVFVVVVLVLTQVFGLSKEQSSAAARLTNAVCLASNAAEAVSAADSKESLIALLDEGGNVRLTDGGIEAGYDGNMRPDNSRAAELWLRISWEPSKEDEALVNSSISVYHGNEENALYTLETAVYLGEVGA